jgi:hypothetical protein
MTITSDMDSFEDSWNDEKWVDGLGFYEFCRVYKIFPTLTRDSVIRRICQHVR